MIAKQNFCSRSVFSENLIVIELRKLEMKFDKPVYVHPRYIQDMFVGISPRVAPLFREKCKIMYRY